MNRHHLQSHAQVVEALGGRSPHQAPQILYQEDHSNQINPRRNPRSNFRDRSNRRKTTGFEEIRQEYYQLHHNKAREEPAEQASAAVVHRGHSVDDSEDFFPKPSAFIRAPRRQLPPRRPRPTDMDDDELIGGPANFRTRGSKAADMFQRRRERTDQFILDQENASPKPAAHQVPIQIQLTQVSSPQKQTHRPQQPRHQPAVSHHQQPQQYQQQQYQQPQHQQQQYQQQQYQQPQHHQQSQYQQQRPQQQHHQQQRPQQQQHHQQRPQQQHRQPQHHQQQHQQQHQGHTTVDSRRTRQPLAPKSPRFEPNSPWNDRNMQVGKRFHPNVVPYQDNYNTSPRGWGPSDFGQDNNVKQHYEFTETSQKFNFTPAPRLNKFGSGLKTPLNENYNSRPKSWCDIELTSPQPPPTRRAYPTSSGHQQSSANQFAGQSGWGYGESDEL